jgi:hypothetical protein
MLAKSTPQWKRQMNARTFQHIGAARMATIGASLLLTHGQALAQTISLQCSGTFYSYNDRFPMEGAVKNEPVKVDLDTKQVSGLYPGNYPIVRIDNQTIVFSMEVGGNDNSHVLGNIDRVTGKTTVFAFRHDRPGQMAFHYDLMCYLGRRLF